MYCDFYHFSEKPFNITPDPKFLFLGPTHGESLSSLIYGIRERRGFIVIMGEVGTGKTLLINTAIERLDGDTEIACINNPAMTFLQILNMALFEFGIANPDEKLSKELAIHRLNDFVIRQLASGGNVVLVVDEGQGLDLQSLENIRLLSNLETAKQKLLQIIISGQPELDAILRTPELRQLAQRISIKRYLMPLDEKETYAYLKHRITVANYKGFHLFERRAMKLIWEYSKGIPRKINVLCDNALLIGYANGVKKITYKIIEEAIHDLCWSPFLSPNESQVDETRSDETRSDETRPDETWLVRTGDSESEGNKVTLYLLLQIITVSLLVAGCIIIATWLFFGNQI